MTVITTIAVFTHIYFDLMQYPLGEIIDFYVYLPYIPSVILLRFIGLLILPHSAFRLFIFFGTYNRLNSIVGAVNTYIKINIYSLQFPYSRKMSFVVNLAYNHVRFSEN